MVCFLFHLHDKMKERLKIIINKKERFEKRFFAFLELVLFPLSVLTVLSLFAQVLFQRVIHFPSWWITEALPVLISAAIGYLTNWIAIEMLFKPFKKTWRHPFSILSFGYWQQGLIPKNKSEIAEKSGDMVEKKLLDPKLLAKKVCDIVINFIHDRDLIDKLKFYAQRILLEKKERIIEFIVPIIEKSLGTAIDRMVTVQNVQNLWQDEIEPLLISEKNRKFISEKIVDMIQKVSPQLMLLLKNGFRQLVSEFLEGKGFGFLKEKIANGLVSFINWDEIQMRICSKLGEKETLFMIADEIMKQVKNIHHYLESPDGQQKINAFLNDKVRDKFKAFLREYLEKMISDLLEQTANSKELWTSLEKLLLESENDIKNVIQNIVIDKIQNGLNIKEEVIKAINKQDIKEFHEMIDSVAAQHLGAIQVLGYVLGALIGLVNLLVL